MQIDIEAAARMAPAGIAAETPPTDLVQGHIRWARTATVLAATTAVLLASCLAVIIGLS